MNHPSPMSELSDERLRDILAGTERATPGPWGVWREPAPTKNDAIIELAEQVHQSEPFAEAVYLLNAGGKCPATTGCGPTSEANAAHLANCDPDTIASLVTELQAARAKLAKYEEAVKPFAEAAADIDPFDPDSWEMWEHHASMSVTVGDFRRLAALTQETSNEQG